jgi:hypothetical protein
MMDHRDLIPGEVRITSADLPTLERLHLLHAVLDDAALLPELRLPAWLRRALLEHARGLVGLGPRNLSGDLTTAGLVPCIGLIQAPIPTSIPTPSCSHLGPRWSCSAGSCAPGPTTPV